MRVPDAAVEAAYVAEAEHARTRRPDGGGHAMPPRDQVRRMLEAAAPVLAAEERARIRALLPYNVNCCEGFPAAVADMIGEHGDDAVNAAQLRRAAVPPGRYAQGARSPVVYVWLCAPCAGFAPLPGLKGDGAYHCGGCGYYVAEVHRFPAVIDSARDCCCPPVHQRVTGDLRAHAHKDEPDPALVAALAADYCEVPS